MNDFFVSNCQKKMCTFMILRNKEGMMICYIHASIQSLSLFLSLPLTHTLGREGGISRMIVFSSYHTKVHVD